MSAGEPRWPTREAPIRRARVFEKLVAEPGHLTVAQLLAALQQVPQDAPVDIEGCDCTGSAGSVELRPDGTVLIGRLLS